MGRVLVSMWPPCRAKSMTLTTDAAVRCPCSSHIQILITVKAAYRCSPSRKVRGALAPPELEPPWPRRTILEGGREVSREGGCRGRGVEGKG